MNRGAHAVSHPLPVACRVVVESTSTSTGLCMRCPGPAWGRGALSRSPVAVQCSAVQCSAGWWWSVGPASGAATSCSQSPVACRVVVESTSTSTGLCMRCPGPAWGRGALSRSPVAVQCSAVQCSAGWWWSVGPASGAATSCSQAPVAWVVCSTPDQRSVECSTC